MYSVDIPGFGEVRVEYLVSDFTGTLSVDGALLPGVEDRLNRISEFMQVQILTADTFGKAREALEKVNCTINILTGADHDLQKEAYVKELGPEKVVALGNGNNDRKLLAVSRVGIAVAEGEGCAVEAIVAANILVRSAADGLDLLLNPKRLKATLRY
jgi:soluble P-type ATPase